MIYRVLIPTAGLGSRLNKFCKNINKALISISHKPAISYIIEKFDKDIEFVIPLGYKGHLVRDFLTLAYPDRKFIFVEVNNYDIGLGYTILKCEKYLQMPFVFISNDTIVLEDIKPPINNWMGYAIREDNTEYRSIKIEKDIVTEICAKGAYGDVKAYIGLCGINNYLEFWKQMENGVTLGSLEVGESYGLRFLIKDSIEAICFTWFDTGNLESLKKTRDYFKSNIDANILEKEEEAIWFVDNKVIKFSTDVNFIENRVERAKKIKDYIPNIIGHTKNMYVYDKVDGVILSNKPNSFKDFLNWIYKFWEKYDLDLIESEKFNAVCMDFYKVKTYKRVNQYFSTFEQFDTVDIINGKEIPKIFDLLDKIDWVDISKGVAVRFHGDLHFENILVADTSFKLLDWRQDFGGSMEYGDIYYDFAKLNHGLIISHELIDKNMFDIDRNANIINYDFLRKNNIVECEKYFKDWIINNGYDYKKVQLMTALIFLNIAALHHYPYSSLLFYLGKKMLFDVI